MLKLQKQGTVSQLQTLIIIIEKDAFAQGLK